jgi:hypothetical protein
MGAAETGREIADAGGPVLVGAFGLVSLTAGLAALAAALLICLGLVAPCNRASAPGPRPAAREHWPTSSLYPDQRRDPVPMTTSRITASAPAPPLPPARDKTFTIEAERRRRNARSGWSRSPERVDAYRGKS